MSIRRSVGLFTAVLTLVGAPVNANAQARAAMPSPAAAFAVRLDSLVPGLLREVGARGAAIALIEGGEVRTIRTYGFADRERLQPVTEATTFNVASVSKAATAWAVMRLVEEGRIALDDPVSRHVRRWRLPASEWGDSGVTVRRLLSHTAGVSRHSTGIWHLGDTLPSLEAALTGENNGLGPTVLQSQPGTRFSYSGGGYSILQLLLEEVTGTSFASHMERTLLRPLGMRASEYGWTERTLPTSATSYSELGSPLVPYRTVEVATGALNVTIGDLARFAAAHVGRTPGRGVLKPATVAQMVSAAPATDSGYGLGLGRQYAPGGRLLVGHDGGNPGWGAVYRVDPMSGDGIAILVNRSWGAEFYVPLLCEWRNATAGGTPAERCGRFALATITTAMVDSGLAVGRATYARIRAARPMALGAEQMGNLSRRFLYNGREADAVEVLRWAVESEPESPRAHELLGDALVRAGRAADARASLAEAVRLAPGNTALREKLARLAPT